MPLPDRTPVTPEQLRSRAGLLCVALSGSAMLRVAERHAAARPAEFLEFRLDSVDAPDALLPGLRSFLATHPDITAIGTCRRTAYGGNFTGSARQQVDLLREAARAGCLLIDIEVETAEELGHEALAGLRAAGAAVILSWHDFHGTPELEPVLQRMAAFSPDFLKVVPTAQSLRDSLRVVDLLQSHGGRGDLIAMAMGLPGVLTRVLGPRYGSAFTFAAPDEGAGTAPGQITATTLRELYRIGGITSQTEVYAVAGSPIGASLSPLMHNTAFRSVGRDAVYLPLEAGDANELHAVMHALDLRGLSITMPLKEAVLPLLAWREQAVEQMGACNTLLRRGDGTVAGYNTDVAGVVEPLERQTSLEGKRVLVLGAGGAARAAIFGVRERGAQVYLWNRTRERAAGLAREAGATVVTREELAGQHFDVVIHTTPYGMRGKQADAPIAAGDMNCDLFFDLVYNPVETPLLQQARARGVATIPGVAMFVAQGVRQFFLWTGQDAPEEDMLRVVLQALSQV